MTKHVVVGTLNEGETFPPKQAPKRKAPAKKRKRKASSKK
jgi:hypothetical protein